MKAIRQWVVGVAHEVGLDGRFSLREEGAGQHVLLIATDLGLVKELTQLQRAVLHIKS